MEDLEELRNRISMLDLTWVKVLHMRNTTNLTNKQIGRKLGCSESTINNEVATLKRHLKTNDLNDPAIKEILIDLVGDPPKFDPWPPSRPHVAMHVPETDSGQNDGLASTNHDDELSGEMESGQPSHVLAENDASPAEVNYTTDLSTRSEPTIADEDPGSSYSVTPRNEAERLMDAAQNDDEKLASPGEDGLPVPSTSDSAAEEPTSTEPDNADVQDPDTTDEPIPPDHSAEPAGPAVSQTETPDPLTAPEEGANLGQPVTTPATNGTSGPSPTRAGPNRWPVFVGLAIIAGLFMCISAWAISSLLNGPDEPADDDAGTQQVAEPTTDVESAAGNESTFTSDTEEVSEPTVTPLGIDGTFEDERISLTLKDFRYSVSYPLQGVQQTAAMVADFEICNHLTVDFLPELKNGDFVLTDDDGRIYGHMHRSHIRTETWDKSGPYRPVTCTTFNVPYDGDIADTVDNLIITLEDFSSLGDVSWQIDVEN